MFFDFASQAKIVQSMTELTLSNYLASSKAASKTMEAVLDSFTMAYKPQKTKKKKTANSKNAKSAKPASSSKKSNSSLPSADLIMTTALAPYKFYADSLSSLQPAFNGWPAAVENFWKNQSGSVPVWTPTQWMFTNPFEQQRTVWEKTFNPFELWTNRETTPFPFWPTNRSPYNNAFSYSKTGHQLEDIQRMMFVFATPPFAQKFGSAAPWFNLWA